MERTVRDAVADFGDTALRIATGGWGKNQILCDE